MNVRPYVLFVAGVYALSAFKTLSLAASVSETDTSVKYVLVRDGESKPKVYQTIDGTDTPMPFTRPVAVANRIVGLSRLTYAVLPGTSIRDTRYPSFFR